MNEQNERNTGNKVQINFKLSVEERQTITDMAASAGLNLSEYCRIKCLMNEEVAIQQQKNIADMEKNLKAWKVKSSCFNHSTINKKENINVGKHDIVIPLTEQQHHLLERLYGNFSAYYPMDAFKNEVASDLRYNLLYTLICLPQLENFDERNKDGVFESVFENKNYEYWEPLIKEAFSELLNHDLPFDEL